MKDDGDREGAPLQVVVIGVAGSGDQRDDVEDGMLDTERQFLGMGDVEIDRDQRCKPQRIGEHDDHLVVVEGVEAAAQHQHDKGG